MIKCMLFATLLLMISLQLYSTDYDTMLRDAKTLVQSGNLQAAEDTCTTVINSRPGSPFEPKARVLMGYISIRKKGPAQQAIEHFLKAADQFPNSPDAPDALLRIGYLRDKTGIQPNEWQRLIDNYPNTKEAAEALHCLGHMALRIGDSELAAKQFTASANTSGVTPGRAEDSSVEGAYAYISQYWKTEDKKFLDGAIGMFKRVKEKPVMPLSAVKACLGLGEIYLIQGSGKKAAIEYRAVLESASADNASRGIAQFELGCALYTQKNWENAETAFESFISSQTGATLKEKDQKWKSSWPGYTDLLLTNPVKAKSLCGVDLVPQAAYWKAETLLRLGRYREAKQLTDDILLTFPDSNLLDRVQKLKDICASALGEDK